MDAESIIDFINKGGAITIEELRHYLRALSNECTTAGAEGYRLFLLERTKHGKERRERREEHEFGQIVIDTAEYLYKMRRLRNGQSLTDYSDEDTDEVPSGKVQKSNSGKEDKRFRGKEKISI